MRDAFVGVMHDLATLVDSAGPGPTEMSGLGNCDHTSLIKKKSPSFVLHGKNGLLVEGEGIA